MRRCITTGTCVTRLLCFSVAASLHDGAHQPKWGNAGTRPRPIALAKAGTTLLRSAVSSPRAQTDAARPHVPCLASRAPGTPQRGCSPIHCVRPAIEWGVGYRPSWSRVVGARSQPRGRTAMPAGVVWGSAGAGYRKRVLLQMRGSVQACPSPRLRLIGLRCLKGPCCAQNRASKIREHPTVYTPEKDRFQTNF